MMGFFRTCPLCGAHLDPGEVCDCKKNTAPVLAHEDGKTVETGKRTISISDDIRVYGGLQE